MMEKFKKMIMQKAKEGKFLSDEDKSAKMDILNEIKDMTQSEMGNDLKKVKGMKKVVVASPTEEGLKEGLEKAGDVVEEKMGEESESEDEEECAMCKEGEMCPECQAKMAAGEMKPEVSDKEKIAKLEEELALLKSKMA